MKISMKYFSLIGILLFIFVLSKIDIGNTIKILLSANPFYIAFSVVILGIAVYIRSLKWRVIVNIFNKNYTTKEAFKTYLIGIAFGSVTPGKAGDLIKVLDLKKVVGMDIKQGISITIFDKLVDVVTLSSIAFISIILIAYKFSTNLDIRLIMILLGLTIFGLIFSLTRHSRHLLRPLFRIFIPLKLKNRIKSMYDMFMDVIQITCKNKGFIYYIFLTILSWLFVFIMPYMFTRAIHLNVQILYFLMFIPVVYLVEALPISLLGVGSRDAALILLFALLNISKEAMVSISLMMLVIGNFPILALGFFFSWKNKYTAEDTNN